MSMERTLDKGGRLSRVMQDRIAGTRQDEKGIPGHQGPKDRYGYTIEGDGKSHMPERRHKK